MGCGASTPKEYTVHIHVYRLVADNGQSLLRSLTSGMEAQGFGAYHSGVEIEGREYAYGRIEKEGYDGPNGTFMMTNGHVTGVWRQTPKRLPPPMAGATFKETITAGVTTMKPSELSAVLSRLQREWKGVEYDLLRHNCNHFTAALCAALGVDGPPEYLNRAAETGAGLADAARSAVGSMLSAGLTAFSGMLNEVERQRRSQSQGSQQQQEQPAVAVGRPVAEGTVVA